MSKLGLFLEVIDPVVEMKEPLLLGNCMADWALGLGAAGNCEGAPQKLIDVDRLPGFAEGIIAASVIPGSKN